VETNAAVNEESLEAVQAANWLAVERSSAAKDLEPR